MKHIVQLPVILLIYCGPALAEGNFICTEIERVSVAEGGKMRPAFPGRELNFRWKDGHLTGDGVFFHDAYSITPLGENGFRASAQNSDRSDLFRLEDNILMHTAIVKYGREPSIQAQVFGCEAASGTDVPD